MPLDRETKALENLIRRLPKLAGNMAVNFYKESFRNQGFTDKSYKRWEPRKRTDRRQTNNRAVLTRSGNLRRSIRLISSNARSVRIGTDEVYAEAHNEGLRAGRGNGFRMPKRQFIGESKQLEDKIEKFILKELNKIF